MAKRKTTKKKTAAKTVVSPRRRNDAQAMAARQREISVSEFFTKNRHLLGFDSPRKALLTTVKEAVDNALDACEEAGMTGLRNLMPAISTARASMQNISLLTNVWSAPNPKACLTLKPPRCR